VEMSWWPISELCKILPAIQITHWWFFFEWKGVARPSGWIFQPSLQNLHAQATLDREMLCIHPVACFSQLDRLCAGVNGEELYQKFTAAGIPLYSAHVSEGYRYLYHGGKDYRCGLFAASLFDR